MKIIAVFLIGVLLAFNTAQAGTKFIPKDGKLWVQAAGEVVVLKSEAAKEEYLALKMEDKNVYILSGESSGGLKKLVGKKAEVNGLLKARIEFGKELIPSIEVKSFKQLQIE